MSEHESTQTPTDTRRDRRAPAPVARRARRPAAGALARAVPARLDAAHRRRTAVRRGPGGHDVARSDRADHQAGVRTSCLSLSAPLGIERLRRPEAQPLIDAWHRGVAGAARPLPGLGLGALAGRRRRGARTAAGRGAVRRPAAPGDRPAHAARLGAPRRAAARGRAGGQAGARAPRSGAAATCWPARCRTGGRRWSATPHSSRRPGGAGTRSAAARCSPAAAGLRRRRRSGAGAPPSGTRCAAAAGRPMDPRRLRGLLGHRPAGPRGGRPGARHRRAGPRQRPAVRRPLAEFLGDAATHAVRVANPTRLLGGVAATRGVNGNGPSRADP